MILVDVNVLVAAQHIEHPLHRVTASLLDSLVNKSDAFGIPEVVLQSVVRITTNPVYKLPVRIEQTLLFCEKLRTARSCYVIQPTATHWETFARLCLATKARGKLVADAYLAAFAVDRDDEWVTLDRDFAKFPGLRWRNLLDGKTRINPR